MVNSGSFDSDGRGDRNAKAGLTQPHDDAPEGAQSSSPVSATVATSCTAGFSRTADGGGGLLSSGHAIEPTPTKTEFNCDMQVVENFTSVSSVDTKPLGNSICCSLPLEKIQGVLPTSYRSPPPVCSRSDEEIARTTKQSSPRKLLCLYCDRSFVSANLRQKHVERIHSVKQNRRVSSRRQNQLTATPCVYCDKLNGTENTLKDLFQHLVNEHSSKYFGCLPCEDRFLTSSLLADHNALSHQSSVPQNVSPSPDLQKTTLKPLNFDSDKPVPEEDTEEIPVKITRSKMKPKVEDGDKTKNTVINNKKKTTKLKELRSKKLSVKSSRIALKRRESKRLQAIAKLTDTQKKKRPRPIEKKNSGSNKMEQTNSTKATEKIKTNQACVNPYPEFDHFYRVKKITDHSIDNLKISSLTFDDVFDKAFFNRIRCNIEENLLHHIDGKLFKNEESESRISNFEKISNVPQEIQNSNSENYGCELSLNAVTPVAALSLNSQFGEDFESQIEYGSKPSKKKTQPRKNEIHYKYFTRRKYQASILEYKENRDLSKLDMWTQLVIKKRQQKMLDDKKSAKEMLEYASCAEYKNKVKREELNRILDRRGPFEDLKEEASKKAALDKLNSASEDNVSEETFTEVREVLNEILNRVFASDEVHVETHLEKNMISNGKKEDVREIPGYLNLRRSSSLSGDGEIDRSDKISLICSSQDTENFELPTNQVRGKNELIELTGEWARCRMYICAACGAKLPNMRYLLDHKSLYHQNVWVQHYEFVGNQSELYRHLSIPALGKVGAVEETVQCKTWRRSDARLCTKCGKQCNSLGELHRHILECGGDWTWMLARKKCKYRPFGAKSRRKRRGLIHRVHNKQKTEPTEKKTYKKTFEGPRQRPSDADTIQRMLANLPAKRSTRKLISLQDGIYRSRKNTQNVKQNKVKCGKVIYKSSTLKETTEKTINTVSTISKPQNNASSSRRSLRNLNKVLASRILDTNSNLNVKRKIKVLNERRRTRQSQLTQDNTKEIINDENIEQISVTILDSHSEDLKKEDTDPEDTEPATKRSSPRSSPKNVKKKMTVKQLLTGKINIKSFFPVKKKKNRKILMENQNPQDIPNTDGEKLDIQTRSKRKLKEPRETQEEKTDEVEGMITEKKKSKHETFSTLVRSLSLRKKKKSIQEKQKVTSISNVNEKQQNDISQKSEGNSKLKLPCNQELDKAIKKRKLKSSFRSVINKVKKLKIDTTLETVKSTDNRPNIKNHKTGPFLDETNSEEPSAPVQVEKVTIPSISEVKENTADISTAASTAINFHDTNENPTVPETIFKLELSNEKSLQAKGELDFDTQPVHTNIRNSSDDKLEKQTNIETSPIENSTVPDKSDKTQPISIETTLKPKVVPLVSPNMKGKIRKPTRGLNDCIAMLTSKLQQKNVEEEKSSIKVNSIFNRLCPNRAPIPFQETYPPKNEFILKIPTYRSQMSHSEVEETALDLSTKSLRNKEQKEEGEVPVKPVDFYSNNLRFYEPQFNLQNFRVPTFERKLTKTFNSIDQIIEEVVENKIQTMIPEIYQRKWNSVDDIIQEVIDGQHSKFQLPVRNSVDEIIDFVVESGGGAGIIYKDNVNIKNINFDKETNVRKIGSIRKSRNKKSVLENGKPEEIPPILDLFPKEPLETNSLVIKPDVSFDISGESTKKGSLKKKNKLTKVIDLQQLLPKEKTNSDVSLTAKILESVPQIVENDDINITSDENIHNITTDLTPSPSVESINSHLNEAFIDSSYNEESVAKKSTGKTKKSTRKVGQARNRSRTKKATESNSPELSEKILIETDVDVLLDVKEIQSNPLVESTTNLCTNNDNILMKSEEIKQISNEDEPLLLENKPMTMQKKPIIAASDSEDDMPLAALVKSDEKGADPSEQLGHKSGESHVNSTQEATEKSNDDLVVLENEDVDKISESENISEEKLSIDKSLPSDELYQNQNKETTNIKDNSSKIEGSETINNERNCTIDDITIITSQFENQIDTIFPLPKETLKRLTKEATNSDLNNSDNQNNIYENIVSAVSLRNDDDLTLGSVDVLPASEHKLEDSKTVSEDNNIPSEIKKTVKYSTEEIAITEVFDENNSALIDFLEDTNKYVKNISDELKIELNSVTKPSENKITNQMESDISIESLLNNANLTNSTDFKASENDTVYTEWPPSIDTNDLKSENDLNSILQNAAVADKTENAVLDLETVSMESEQLSSKIKTKSTKSKGKSKPVKCKLRKSDNTKIECSPKQFIEEQHFFSESDKCSPKVKVKRKSKVKKDNVSIKQSISCEGTAKDTITKNDRNETKEIFVITNPDEETTVKSSIADATDDFSLKELCTNMCAGISTLNEHEETDKEIENILSSPQPEQIGNVRSSSKDKNPFETVKDIIPDVDNLIFALPVQSKGSEKKKEKSNLKKPKRKSSKSMERIKSKDVNVLHQEASETNEIIHKETNAFKKETSKAVITNEAASIETEVNLAPKKIIPKQTLKPILKNLEITLELTDITKSIFSFSGKTDLYKERSVEQSNFKIDSMEPDVKDKKKRQLRSTNKLVTNSCDNSNTQNLPGQENYEETDTIQSGRSSRSRHVKNKTNQDVTALQELSMSLDKDCSYVKEFTEEMPEETISQSKDMQEKNGNDVKNLNERDNTSSNIENDRKSEELPGSRSSKNMRQKLKRNRRSVKSCKRKNKNKGDKIIQNDKTHSKIDDTEKVSDKTTIAEETIISLKDDQINKTLGSSIQGQPKENTSENILNKASEPPIKIIINKQKTRRKSKSFKKIDLKGQNDLFEDFSLVIKKPKRLTPIVAFTPTDTFSKDIYPSYPKKTIDERLPGFDAFNENEDLEALAELDSSVEEMDMELDEIPITTNIIERDTNSFLSQSTSEFVTPNESVGETFQNQFDNIESNIEDNALLPIEELLLPPEKNLVLPTEADVKEFLLETSRRPTRNKMQSINRTEYTLESSNKDYRSNGKNKNGITDNSSEVQNLTNLTFDFEYVSNTSSESNNGNVIEEKAGTESNSDTNKTETKVSSAKLPNRKPKKFKNNKNSRMKTIIGASTESKEINSKFDFAPLKSNGNCNKIKKRKRSKSTTLADISSFEALQSFDNCSEELNKLKDIEGIYAFSESEDFEIEKPIEKSKRTLKKKTEALSESVDVLREDLNTVDCLAAQTTIPNQSEKETKSNEENKDIKEAVVKLNPNKRKCRSITSSSERSLTCEIKENDMEVQEERRRSVRSAKVKALEHIHDDALAELTESERNRDLENAKTKIVENVNSPDEVNKRRNSRRQSKSQKVEKELESVKLPEDSKLTSNSVNNDQELELLEQIPTLTENINEVVKPVKTDKLDIVSNIAAELNLSQNVSCEINDKLDESLKKKSNKNTNNKTKVKNPLDIFQVAAEETIKCVILKEIVSDVPGLEELENSIEKELNTDPKERIPSKLRSKTKQAEPLEETKLDESRIEKNESIEEENNQELRRSRRGSRKIASYNENDLIDPLLDEIDGKKRIRKKEKIILEEFENNTQKQIKDTGKKLNADELFDMLKASSNEKNSNQKSVNTSDCDKDDTFKEFKGHSFENAFDSIHKSSLFLNQNRDDNKDKEGKSIDSIYEFSDSPENLEQKEDGPGLDITRKQNTKVPRYDQLSKSNVGESYDSRSVNYTPNFENKSFISSAPDLLELSVESKTKSSKSYKSGPKEKSTYCEICNKKFVRTESLVKHKRTLTHIQKLSEIEAKEAAQKSQTESSDYAKTTSVSVIEITSDSSKVTENLSKGDIDIHDILQDSNKPNRQEPLGDPIPFTNNHSLKLADIINDVLNKPVLQGDNEKHNNFSDIIMQNNTDIQPEYRRYKSLGERKSFDSEPIEPQQVHISEPYISKTTILEKQISLLENIIENQAGVNYIDEISISSNNSLENNALVSPSELSLKQDDSNTYSRINLTKANINDDSFLKPAQYEEISQDSVNLRNYEDQKLRKTLNRDEELFLECCSLLKSGSEMSSYSNKKLHHRVLNGMGLKHCDEPEWLERKSLVEKPLYDVGHEYSDNSRIPTPLGDSYDDDASNSNTITSNWNINKKVNIFEDISQDKEDDVNKSFSFQEILNEEEAEDKACSGISKFKGILSKTIEALPNIIKRTVGDNHYEEVIEKKQDELSDGSTSEGKKIITKGARKVFEGLKVSIPTEELNLEEVLNFSPKVKTIDLTNGQSCHENAKIEEQSKPSRNARKSKPVKNKSQFGSKLLFKMKKKKVATAPGMKNKSQEAKPHDIYDFEETQDNSDVFTKPDFRAFRNMKSTEIVPEASSDTDSRDYIDSVSYEAQSVTSSISSSSSKKPKTQENITKKKCMIMGRIFKNAAKSKIEDIDEEIRDIPPLENCELVESYVADCEKVIKNDEIVKPKLTEREIDQLFDELLEDRCVQDAKKIDSKTCTRPKVEVKRLDNKKKPKLKNKKRTRTNSDSTDDEFDLNKINKKRAYRKNAKAEDNCINLEQELKECIGVASRKSQRKCTSGKQNVLVEYWSSDDSQFEALMETQRIETKQSVEDPEENKNMVEFVQVLQALEECVEINSVSPEKLEDLNSLEKYKPKNIEKKHTQKRKLSCERKPKLVSSGTEKMSDTVTSNRRKRAAVNPLYHWSSSSEDESQDLIEVKPIRDELEDDEDRPVQHGWIVGDSPKKLVTMLAQAKGKKTDIDCVKEQGKKRTNAVS